MMPGMLSILQCIGSWSVQAHGKADTKTELEVQEILGGVEIAIENKGEWEQ